ncbi:MAG: DUF1501 domain-containing protein [Verrucomicrobiales bacterium]|nr:DUF1501 domain-containing protein [Verrucomicrobiales bacterium]
MKRNIRHTRTNCEGFGRRDFIQTGLSALGGMSLPGLLQSQAMGDATKTPARCIMIWLDGGPSHYETFDPKPDAPSEIRGEFGTVPTTVPGVHFCDTMPKLAKEFHKFTVVRSIAHNQNNHGAGNHYLMTGSPTPVPVGCGAYVTFHPSFGSVVSRDRRVPHGLPAYISTPRVSRSGGPNFLGAQHAPFVISDNPDSKSFRVRDVTIPADIAEGRARSRADLRHSLDRMKRITDQQAEDPATAFDEYYARGFDIITSPAAQEAFDISKENEKVRESYGRNDFGQRLLLARRLTEVGVPFVTVYYGGWDDHRGLFESYKKGKIERVDTGVAALLKDLSDRGSLDNTLVLLLGEFGRTPKINKDAGRDHWSFAMSVLMAGAGIPGGQIVGATDVKGYYANENVYAPEDFAASLYTKMGIDHQMILRDTAGRPRQLVNNGRIIKELFV